MKTEFIIGPENGRPQRLVFARRGGKEYRDTISPNSATARKRFLRAAREHIGLPYEPDADLERGLLDAVDAADAAEVPEAVRNDGDREKESHAEILLRLAADVDLFANEHGQAFATIQAGDHNETYSIRSKGFRGWLVRLFYEEQGRPPGAQTLQDVLGVLEARAMHGESQQQRTFLRVGNFDDAIYLDLGDSTWRAVEISACGWRVVGDTPCKFRRSRTMAPLPIPVKGGCVDELWRFINVSERDRPLLLGWFVAAMRPTGPYPFLLFQAEQGSGKSTSSRVLRSLFDPSSMPLRAAPKDPRDLAIGANGNWCVAFDNMSAIDATLSDALCRLSTGGGFATRELYSDGDEAIFDGTRPAILNGIEFASRPDLLDRSLMIALPRIADAQRRTEAEFWAAFSEVQPRLIGALLDAVVVALRRLPEVRLDAMPRMADFATWATAAEPGLGLAAGEFMAAYAGNRAQGHELALESSPVANALRVLMAREIEWLGAASELLTELEGIATPTERKSRGWPADATRLSGALQRLSPNLRAIGIDVEHGREASHKRRRFWRLTRTSDRNSVRERPSVRESLNPRENEHSPRTLSDADPGFSDAADAKNPPGGTLSDAADADFPSRSRLPDPDEFDPNDLLAQAAAEDSTDF